MPVGSVPAARPMMKLESGSVASAGVGANVTPTIEPVAMITAEFAPASACAIARRKTFLRARASPETLSAVVAVIIRGVRSLLVLSFSPWPHDSIRTCVDERPAYSAMLRLQIARSLVGTKKEKMPVIDKIKQYQNELVAIRHDLHAHPEIGFEEVRTANI